MESDIETYRLEQDDKSYIVTCRIKDGNKLCYTCQCENDPNDRNIYGTEKTIAELKRENVLFSLFNNVDQVKNELNKALAPDNPQVGIDQVQGQNPTLIFYTEIGTDENYITLPLEIIPIPQNEEAFDYQVPEVTDINYVNLAEKNKELQAQIQRLTETNANLENEVNELRKTRDRAGEKINDYNRAAEEEQIKQTELEKKMQEELDKQQQLEKIKKYLEYQNRVLKEQTGGLDKNVIQVPSQHKKNEEIVKGEIIHSSKELEFICRNINTKGKNINFNLVYKATKDGDSAADFHSKCDSAQCSVVLVETKKGKRFGGYTSRNWLGDGEDKRDENAFVFMLGQNEKELCAFSIKNGQPAIGCYREWGPVFMGCQIKINDNCFENGGSTYKKGRNYGTTEDFQLTGGSQLFNVKEVEVYSVTFE